MTIDKNHVVALHYTLNAIEENGEKTFIEKTETDNPFTFLYGVGMMLPKFEEELQGMVAGDKKSFTITPEEGYGEKIGEATTQLPIAMFEQSGMPPIGAMLPLQANMTHLQQHTDTQVHHERTLGSRVDL